MTHKPDMMSFVQAAPTSRVAKERLTPVDVTDIPDSKPGSKLGTLRDALDRARARKLAGKPATPQE